MRPDPDYFLKKYSENLEIPTDIRRDVLILIDEIKRLEKVIEAYLEQDD